MSKKTISTIIQLIVFLGLGIGLIIWRYNEISPTDKTKMFAAFKNIQWIWIVPLFIVGFFSHYFRALRWKLFMRPLRIFPSTVNTLFAVLTGYLANALIPRLGEVAKCTILAKYEKAPVDKLVGTIIAERAFDLASLIFLMLVTLVLQFDIIYPYAAKIGADLFLDSSGDIRWLYFGLILVIVLAFSFVIIRLSRKLKGTKVGGFIKGMGDGLKSIGKIKNKGYFLLLTVLIWGMYTSLIIIAFFAMPEMKHIPLLAALAILTFGSVGMIITPGGIGAYPVIIAELLLLYGVNTGIGFAYGWVCWTGQTVIVVVFGVASLILIPIYNRKKRNEKYTGEYFRENNDPRKVKADY